MTLCDSVYSRTKVCFLRGFQRDASHVQSQQPVSGNFTIYGAASILLISLPLTI